VPLLSNLRTYGENSKIIHVTRFIKTNVNGIKEGMETMVIHVQSTTLHRQVRLYGGLVFHVQSYKKSPFRCKRCLHFGHSAKLCKHKFPNCRVCAGAHSVEDCTNIQEGSTNSPTCLHCKGPHYGESTKCPKYQEVERIIQSNPYPNLHHRKSLSSIPPPPLKPFQATPRS
jgi:hypothetical protein